MNLPEVVGQYDKLSLLVTSRTIADDVNLICIIMNTFVGLVQHIYLVALSTFWFKASCATCTQHFHFLSPIGSCHVMILDSSKREMTTLNSGASSSLFVSFFFHLSLYTHTQMHVRIYIFIYKDFHERKEYPT